MIDETTAIAVGDVGTVVKTTDGGISWIVQHYVSGTTVDLESVFFVNADTGWAVGNYGTIIKTIDGGVSWFLKICKISEWLFSVFFIDADTGWTVGWSGTILK